MSNSQNLSVIRIEAPDEICWDDASDVLVVGFGGAGACAAIEAREQGAQVTAFDRFAGGGATAYSGGIIYAGGTRFQREAGFEDSAEQMYAYLRQEVGDVVTARTLRRYCDESAANLDWLIAQGVPYASEPDLEKTIYPPDGKYLYDSGNEKVPEFAASALPAPRGHRPVGTGLTGHIYYEALANAAKRAGVVLRTHEQITRLVVDGSARVIGVETAPLPEYCRSEHQRLYAKVVPMMPFKAATSERATAAARSLEQAVSSGRLFFKFYGVPALLNIFLGGTRRASSLARLADKCETMRSTCRSPTFMRLHISSRWEA
jgi:3-oxo-5alpha-steroid 4-dehydrogenase